MNWVDAAVLAVLLVSGLLGFARGLVREALGLAAWVLAAILAARVFPAAVPFALKIVADPAVADPAAFAVVFVVLLILLYLVVGVVSRLVRGSMLGGLDRSLGFVYGVARGAVIVIGAYILGGMASPVAGWPAPVLAARSLPLAYQGAVWASNEAPPAYRPHVEAPPATPEDAAALMQAPPEGRLFAPPQRAANGDRETR